MTIEQKVENITGDLREYKQLVPGTFKHVDQLMKERQTDESLRSQWFYTADGELYFLKDKKPMLAITRESDNLVLRHIDDAFTQLTKIGNYLVDKTEAQASIESKNTVLIDLSKLRLSDGDSEYKCLVIDTKNYAKKLNSEEKRLAKRVYGSGKDLAANMKMLNDAGISETRIYVLNPEYIQKKAQNGPLGRASWLDYFNFRLLLLCL